MRSGFHGASLPRCSSIRVRAAAALRSDNVSWLTARSVIQYRISPNAMRALSACSMPLSNPAALTMPAEFSPSARVRYKFVAIRTRRAALASRIRRVRIVSRAMITLRRRPVASMIEGNADDRPKITRLAALFRVAGQVHFAFGRTVAGETGCRIVLGNRDSECRTPAGVDDGGIGLPLGPLGTEQLGLHDVGLPGVWPRLAVAHQLGWCSHLHLGLAFGHLIEVFADETCEYRGDEALERRPLLVDRRLVVVGHGDDRRHHCAKQPPLP